MPILVSPTSRDAGGNLPPSFGAVAVDWMEDSLIHGEGDLEGQPFRLLRHLVRLTYRWLEYGCGSDPDCDARSDRHWDPDELAVGAGHKTRYVHKDGLVGYPKGSAKTEWEQALALEHMEGPSLKLGTPVTLVAGVDGDQADVLVRRAGMMVPESSELAARLDIVSGRIRQRGANGEIRSTSAAIGKNDGALPDLYLVDELHEWDGKGTSGGRQRFQQIERAVIKRFLARRLTVTTAGWSLESVLGALFRYGCKVASGEIVDPTFLFEWWCSVALKGFDPEQPDVGLDLEIPTELVEAINQANPMCHPDAIGAEYTERLVRLYAKAKLGEDGAPTIGEFIRFHLNLFLALIEDLFMDMALWERRRFARRPPADGTDIVLGFDGSWNGDSTALVGVTIERRPHVFTIACWEKPDPVPPSGWSVPVDDVVDKLRVCCKRWNVKELAADTFYWQAELARLEKAGVVVTKIRQNGDEMVKATRLFTDVVQRDMLSHDGDPRLARHMGNARKVETTNGWRIEKEHKNSKLYIDLAVAAVMGAARAVHLFNEGLGSNGPAAAPAAAPTDSRSSIYRPRERLRI